MSSSNWLQLITKQSASVSDIADLESWNNWAQASSDLDFNSLRAILGNITAHLNEISLIFKQGVRGGSQQTVQRAAELIPDVQNMERLHQAANQAYTILSTKASGNPQEVMLKNMLHSIVRMNFTPQQKSAFNEISQGNIAQTQFAEEVNAEKLNQFLQTSIYSVKDPEQKTLKVFREVLQNAADAALQQHTVDPSHAPSVSINTQEYQDDKGRYMDLMIQDNGVGMNWDILSQKFFVYFQSGKESTEATGGFGIAKAVIQETPGHGWSIDSNGIHASRFSKNVYMGERAPEEYQPPQSEVQPGRGTTLNLYHLPAAGQYSMSDLCKKYASENLQIQLNNNVIKPLFKLSELTTVEGDLSGVVDTLSDSDAERNVAADIINKESGPEPLGRMTYPQSTIDFHIRKISYSGRFYVLLNGQYQYDVHEYIPKAEIICSVKTTARPGSEEYPMDPGRDNLRSPYKEDVARIISKLKEMFTKIAESEIFKDGLDITIYNKDKPVIGMREEDRSEEEWQKRRILERALEGSIGSQSGIYGEPNAPSTLRGTVADAEELARALQDNMNAIASDKRQESIVSAAVGSLMQEKGDKIDVQKEMDKIIAGLMTPASIIIQKNFVSPNIAHDNPEITANLIILWQEILKALTDSFGDYFKSYRSADYIPGLVYSNECVALYNRTKQVDYAMISINPMIVASILHTGAFEKWVNNDESASGAFEDAYSSINDITPINRIASLLFHSAIHELTHLYYPDSWSHDNFHNNITRLESKAHFMFKPIRDLVKKHMPGLKKDMMNLIRVVRDDRKQRDSAKSMMMPLQASALITGFHRAIQENRFRGRK